MAISDVRLSLPTVVAIAVIVGAGAFAAGRAMPSAASGVAYAPLQPEPAQPLGGAAGDDLPPGHPAPDNQAMPPGHPAIGDVDPTSAPATAETKLTWKVPPRWKEVPNPSTMRLATYEIPGPDGKAELSVTQAGGSVDANAQRWIGQFDAASQKSAKRTTKKIAGYDVTIVEVQGVYSGAMSGDGGANTALLGAIVSTPGMPYFFKMTGPAKTVAGARAELDQLLATLAEASH